MWPLLVFALLLVFLYDVNEDLLLPVEELEESKLQMLVEVY
jgi:hypothetical protein